MTAPPGRLPWLDISKGLGIILVVAGHVLLRSETAAAQQAATLIYAFHMPLFFLLAGVTLPSEPVGAFARRKLLHLALPHLMFVLLLGVPSLVLSCGMGTMAPDLGIEQCGAMAVKLVLSGSMLGGIFGTFWFVPCLFWALVLAQLLLAIGRQHSTLWRTGAWCALVGLGYALPHLLPDSTSLFALGVAPMATALVLLGYGFSPKLSYPAAPNLLLAGTIAIFAHAPLDMKFANYGLPVLSLAGAVALSCLLVQLARLLALYPWLGNPIQAFGKRTLTILYLHQLLHLPLRELGLRNDILLILAALCLPLLLHPLLSWSLNRAETWLHIHLSRKSPSL